MGKRREGSSPSWVRGDGATLLIAPYLSRLTVEAPPTPHGALGTGIFLRVHLRISTDRRDGAGCLAVRPLRPFRAFGITSDQSPAHCAISQDRACSGASQRVSYGPGRGGRPGRRSSGDPPSVAGERPPDRRGNRSLPGTPPAQARRSAVRGGDPAGQSGGRDAVPDRPGPGGQYAAS